MSAKDTMASANLTPFAYTKCLSRQMRMTAEDGKRLLDDCQQITQKIAKSFTNGRPTGRA
jgi:hypothetical protein